MPMSRRSLLGKGSVAAAGVAGASVIGLPHIVGSAASLGAAGNGSTDLDELSEDEILASESVIVDIKDVATGEIEILVGEQSVTYTDKAFVARVIRAAR